MSLSTVDRLTLLWEISQLFSSTLNLNEVLNLVIDEVIAALRAERGIILLYDDKQQLQVRVARGVDQQTLESPEFEFSRSIVERVAREGEPQLTSDAQDERWLSQRESVISLGLRSVLCVPLQVKGSQIGVIYVDNRLQAGLFMPPDLELLTTIATSAAGAIENARLYEIAVEKGRMERELQMARELQAGFIPRDTPRVPGWEIAARWYPARQVSGDYFDFLQPEPDRLGVVIADVSDKGMPAALFMTLTRSLVRASLADSASPAAGIASANRLLCADASRGMFVTLFYLALDAATGELTYVNAGHNPPILYRPGAAEMEALTRTGMLLGIEPAATYEEGTTRLAPGDLLLLYTDGVTEAVDPAGEMFGEERLRALIRRGGDRPADELLDRLTEAVRDFTVEAAPFDDIALVLLKRCG